jgi:hypothetical protein
MERALGAAEFHAANKKRRQIARFTGITIPEFQARAKGPPYTSMGQRPMSP